MTRMCFALLLRPNNLDWVQLIPRLENGVYWYISSKTFGFTTHPALFLSDMDMSSEECEVVCNSARSLALFF